MCETFSKQIQIVAPGGRATSDGKVIGEHAWRLLKSFSFDPKELRGIAIQIQKLEKLSVGPDAEQRQAVLPFRRVEKHVENVDDLESKPSPLPIVALHDDAVEVVEVGKPTVKSRNPTAGSFNLPSFSQVDPSVFEALPEDIRRELEGEYERRGVPEPQLEAGPSKPTKDLISFLTVPKVQIAVKGSKPPNLKRITQQLAPRNKSTLASTKAAQLFSPKKEETASGSGVSKTTEVELRRLGIDLEVFAQLPEELQAEQLSAARMMEVNKGRGQAFGGPRKVLKPVRAPRYVDPGYVPYLPPPPPKANYGPPPTSLKRPGREKGSGVLRFTDTDEVMDVIGQWVDKFSEHPPHAKDVQFFASYLVKCVDSTVSPDSGLERGVAVMKWWLVLLRRKYAAWEDKNDDDEEDLWATPLPKNRSGFTSEDIGRAWWNAFKDVKSQMDIAARKKFGGRISLK